MIEFKESEDSGYKQRTIINASADATIAFAVDFTTAGEILTKKSVISQNNQYIAIDANNLRVTEDRINTIVYKLNLVSAKTLNIAGNGLYTLSKLGNDYTQEQIDEFTFEILHATIIHPKLQNKIESIRSGGQSGFDEAGIKAAVKLGIPAIVLAPKGWRYRPSKGLDIVNEQMFKARFELSKVKPDDKFFKEYDLLSKDIKHQLLFIDDYYKMDFDFLINTLNRMKVIQQKIVQPTTTK